MRKTYCFFVGWILILLTVMACSFSFGGNQDEEEAIQTAIAETLAADQDQEEEPEQPAAEPTITIAPTDTIAAPPTNTPSPCNRAYFVSETIPDRSDFEVGESFTKTWRLENTGTCTWNTSYRLKFASGDQMGGPNSQNLTQSVAPGEQVDISVDLAAPGSEGTYKGVWQIVDDEGNAFVYNIWVQIDALESAATEPDLTITEFSLNPATPVQGENVHVRVRAANTGDGDSGGFKVEWYGLSTFASPSCNWNVNGGLDAGHSTLLECDYSFASWYPANKTTIVFIDTDDDVDESDEGNNASSISPFGVDAP